MEEGNEEFQTKESVVKKSTAISIGIIIVVIVALFLVGYFAFNKGLTGSKNIAGYYELYEMSSGDQSYSHEDIENLKSLGLNVTLELKDDKTGVLNLFGETVELTYDKTNMIVDNEPAPYKIEDGKITMEQDGEKLVFQKAEKAGNTEPAEEQK